ncbi:helix-turn-helix domain-containing protein [Mucilaginibacter pallidiroseus]|uniref:helix-turn-helix domain-containing protein n=1 Tax=Mucilaginibacter pallidiroseus TaxID=2599295 RepID=UPI001C947021|nr:helix-turn-helix domain-containing protein [Mucilaginibacter pallidiroseus]
MPTLPAGVVTKATHPIASLQKELSILLEQDKISEVLNLVQDWFLIRYTASNGKPLLVKAGKAMVKGNGALPIAAVAEAAHSTVRTLERKFKASSGRTVKDVSGLMRFEQTRDRLWGDPELNVAGLAHELGYADQSHINREFKRYSGITAAAFAKQIKVRKATFGNDLSQLFYPLLSNLSSFVL